jgi:hypothetical protein
LAFFVVAEGIKAKSASPKRKLAFKIQTRLIPEACFMNVFLALEIYRVSWLGLSMDYSLKYW